MYMVYVEDKNLYLQRIELLKKLYKDYGYFMNYFFFSDPSSIDTECFQLCFCCYWFYNPDIEHNDPKYDKTKYPTDSFFYYPNRTVTGIIPDLYNLGYYDLLDKYLEECFLLICLNYRKKESKYDEFYKVNDNDLDIKIKDNFLITDPIKFLREKNYKLPKELDEFWKERGL